MKKRLSGLVCLLLCAALLSSCTAAPSALPSLTLPPVSAGPEAPIGDAGLQHETLVTLHLPSLDGQTLLTLYQPLHLSYDQHPAETILRALLNHQGSSRVRPLGGNVPLTLAGANPIEISGGVCTVNLSASALQLSSHELYSAALAIAATLGELSDVDYVNLLIAGSPVAMDVSGNLPLGTVTAQPGQELPVLWEQFSSRRTPLGELASGTPMTATATLYFPLSDGSGIAAEPRRISFPGQHPQQQVIALLEALSGGAELLHNAADMPDIASMELFFPEVTALEGGGRRVTLHLTADVENRLSGCDMTCFFAAVVTTLTTFIPSVQQVCVLTGDGALTSLYNAQLGSLLFPGGLMTRADFAHTLVEPTMVCVPANDALSARLLALPYRSASSPRALLLALADFSAAPLTDADILGIAIQDGTLLVNFSDRYADLIRTSGQDQRLLAYSIVNTLCQRLNVRRVRFFFGGKAVDSLDSELLWSGEFLYNPGLISH